MHVPYVDRMQTSSINANGLSETRDVKTHLPRLRVDDALPRLSSKMLIIRH